ncbi:MAG: dihydropyrimidinase [Ardenticatenaceae bacterium]|nr:dihydropyrimidinase [Anaerolineales bacterium]MCB8921602.1 dihydropyrimidinase [Ardenticatenaceae bacterium]
MAFDLVIKNGEIVTAQGVYRADVGVRGERIAAIGESLQGRREIAAAGKYVTPGAVDVHVHLEMPIGDIASTDDFYTGTRAAAFGGTTTIIDFVEPEPEETLLEALASRRACADDKVVIDYGLHMTLGPAEIPKLDQVAAAYAAGCASFKLYMAYDFRLNDGEMLQALTAVHNTNGLPIVHAENWDVITMLIAENVGNGRTTPHYHPRSRPAKMEGEAAGRIINLAEFVGTRLYVFHVSCGETVDRIATARQRGLPIYGETCPQYLLLDWSLYDRPGVLGALPVCSPPIRAKEEQARLWQALSRNHLQAVSTDHCPFTMAEKERGLGDYSQIPGGVPSIEVRFTAVYSAGVRAGHLSLPQWVDVCCTTPARLFGLPRKGQIAVGYDADLVIFDPEREMHVSPKTLHETAGWTLYEGMTLHGWPEMTISHGQVIVEDGELVVGMGNGRFLRRGFGKM